MTLFIQPSGVLPGGVIQTRDFPAHREPWVELGWPGLEPKRPCLDVFIFDSSGSVIAPQGTDPVGNRFAEAARAIRLTANWSFTDRSKVAVLHFDDPVGASGVVALNDRHLMRRLERSLQNPRGSGISDLRPSLLAMERLAAAHSDHDVRATIFSDFELTDDNVSELFSQLLAFPGLVHAVILGGQVPPDLIDAENVTITPLNPDDPPGAFAAAIHRSLTATRRGRRHSVLHGSTGNEVLS
ncbi:vWA domain-containing protein [uncultured Microbacterium sp.]|uniref:vWA domain-containing protein n=1 Tax=uncultured Microbacterium sp. TaxID=191216 RepID=UPI0035CB99B9